MDWLHRTAEVGQAVLSTARQSVWRLPGLDWLHRTAEVGQAVLSTARQSVLADAVCTVAAHGGGGGWAAEQDPAPRSLCVPGPQAAVQRRMAAVWNELEEKKARNELVKGALETHELRSQLTPAVGGEA